MQTPRFVQPILSFALAAALAGCDEAPTNIEPSSAAEATGADLTDADAAAMAVGRPSCCT